MTLLFSSLPASNSQLFLWESINVLTEVNIGNKCKPLKTSTAIKTWSFWCKFALQIRHFYLPVDFFFCIPLSYLQFLILFLIMKWSEKDVMLQIKSPEMDRQQRPLSMQFKTNGAKPFLSLYCIFFRFLLSTSYIFIQTLDYFLIRWLALLLHFLHHECIDDVKMM